MKKVYITSANRTAVGSLGKTLKNIPAYQLGSRVISNAIKVSNIKEEDVDEVIFDDFFYGECYRFDGLSLAA